MAAAIVGAACGNGIAGRIAGDPSVGGGAPSASGGGGAGGAVGGGGSQGGGSEGSAGGGGGAPATGGGGGDTARLGFFVSPSGTGSDCSSQTPCSLTQARAALRSAVTSSQGDLTVELADGIYRLDAPLVFGADDSGANGHAITWQAAPGAHPVISGARPVTGWTLSDAAKGIWKASASGAFATRQLYVNGRLATRARRELRRSDMTITRDGFTFSSAGLSFLNGLAHPERADVHAIGSFTDRSSPIKAIDNGTVTMAQPAWEQNTWGYDTMMDQFRLGYVENAYELLDEPGEWYQDTTTETLYYKPLDNEDMTKADVEIPRLEALLLIGGTYDKPAHDLTFRGLTLSHTSWLGPSSSDGYANQQTGAFIVGPRSMYPEFEATRPAWHQMPAAVQVSAAKNISFLRDRFVALGQVGLGIGNDDNAHSSKVGLGADGIHVTGCVFAQIAGGAIVIGGIQANAHHPSDAKMVNQNMTIDNNLIHDIAIDYRDFAAVMFTYTESVVVSHNELFNLPYSGINSGYGWGTNDAGGNGDYAARPLGNLYKYQPRYTTPTTAKNNTVKANLVHHAMLEMNDGGCHYNLSANPGTVVTENYCNGAGSGLHGVIWGEYEDEGSAYLTITKNIFASFCCYVTANANASNNTGHLTFTNNWLSTSNPNPGLGGPANVVSGNVSISGATLPAEAQAVASAAGLESGYADLKTSP